MDRVDQSGAFWVVNTWGGGVMKERAGWRGWMLEDWVGGLWLDAAGGSVAGRQVQGGGSGGVGLI